MSECTCGGVDIGVGVMHEPYCLLSGTHCTRCGGKGWEAVGGEGSDEQDACPVCKATGVRPNSEWLKKLLKEGA